MQFIEAFLGLSPDGGDGTVEFGLLAAVIVVLALIAWRRGLLGSRQVR